MVEGETLCILTTASLVLLPTPPGSFICAVRVDDEVLIVPEITADAEALIVLRVGGNLGTNIIGKVADDRVRFRVWVILLAALFTIICCYIKA